MAEPQIIVLAGGCFWCIEAVFKQVRGVLNVESGYSNGQEHRPSYREVCTGHTGCAEVVKLMFDPAQVGTRQLLEIFFAVHDSTQLNRQGNDIGTQYRSGIYFTTEEQQQTALSVIAEIKQVLQLAQPIVTEVQPLAYYWAAEDKHQDFFERHSTQGYCVAIAAPEVAKFRKTFRELAK